MWACGLMMFEMMTGEHPLWDEKDDDRKKYKQKLKELVKFEHTPLQLEQ